MTAGPPTLTQAVARLDALAAERGVALRPNAPLAPITTLRVGGPADRLAEPSTREELLTALRDCPRVGRALDGARQRE